MNRTQKKRLFQGLLAMGIVLLVLSLLLDGRVPDSLGGMLCGIGSGLLAMAGSTLLNLRHEAKHPEMARQHDIEQKDERNVAIRNRAKAVSGEVLQWAVLAAAWLSIGLDAPLWVPPGCHRCLRSQIRAGAVSHDPLRAGDVRGAPG